MYIQRVHPRGAAMPAARPHRSTWTPRALLGLAALWSLFALTSAAYAAVNVSGNINADTTWTAADSPYTLTGTVTVPVGVTLTIEPGATVVGAGSTFEITVRGTLNASGTAEAPILFRGNNPGANAWEGINVPSGGRLTLRHAEVRDADFAVWFTEPRADRHVLEDLHIHTFNTYGIFATSPTVPAPPVLTVVRARVLGDGAHSTNGLGVLAVALDITGSTFSGHLNGVRISSAPATLRRSIFANNRRVAIETISAVNRNFVTTCEHCTVIHNGTADINGAAFITNRTAIATSGILTVRDSLLAGNRHLVHDISADYTLNDFSRNVWSGGETFAYIDAPAGFDINNLQANPLLVDEANHDFRPTNRSPARFWSPDDNSNVAGALPFDGAPTGPGLHGYWYEDQTLAADTIYEVPGDMVIAPGATLTLSSGTTLRMAANSDFMAGGDERNLTEIVVLGGLVTGEFVDHPVVFTSAGNPPIPGDWYGIRLGATTEHVDTSLWDLGYGIHCIHLDQATHQIAAARLHHCSEAGVLADGGTPVLQEVVAEESKRGIWVRNQSNLTTQVDAANQGTKAALVARRNVTTGLTVERSNVNLFDALIHDNGTHGVEVTSTGDNRQLNLTRSIVAHNVGDGIRSTRSNANSGLTVALDSTAITNNRGSGFQSNNFYAPTTISAVRSNNWGNASAWLGVAPTAGTYFAENPLYSDEANRNYAPTRWSPHRGLGSGGQPGSPIGGTVGPFSYVDAVGPQLMGYLWEDFEFTRQGSPYTLLGDVTVPPGVTVRVQPGVEFRVAGNADGMLGGLAPSRTEVRFLPNSVGILGTPPDRRPALGIAGDPIVFRPVDEGAGLSWQGLRFDDSPLSHIYNVRAELPDVGLQIQGPRAPEIDHFTALHAQFFGIYAADVEAANPVRVHGSTLIGRTSASGTGLLLSNSEARISSSFITHNQYGLGATSTNDRNKTVALVNNTITKSRTGLICSRANSSARLKFLVYNTIVADSSVRAIQDGTSAYPTLDYYYHTSLFNNTLRPQTANAWVAGLVVDPLVEDIDWDEFPRWWDGQVWAESPTIDAGYTGELPFPVATDILGRPRVIGAAADLGAWEFDPASNQEPRAVAAADAIMVPRSEAFALDGSNSRDPDGQVAVAFWTMSDGTITSGLNLQHTFHSEGTDRWAYLTIADDQGAEDHALVRINVNVRPTAEAGPPLFQGAGPAASVSFDGSLSTDPDGTVATWRWDLGDGTFSDLKSPSHTYLSAGLYTVRLTVTDNEGLTHTDTTLATVAGDLDLSGPFIEHTEIEDGQPVNQSVAVRATIRDPSGVASAVLLYRPLGGLQTQFAPLLPVGGGLYEGVIPAHAVTAAGVEYWIVATDSVSPDANISDSPQGAPGPDVYDFLVRSDVDAPAITHIPVANNQAPSVSVAINADVTDATGVAEVRVHFRKVGEPVFGSVALGRVGQTTSYTGQIPAFWVTEVGVEYYIEARDAASLPNTSRLPAVAPANRFVFTVRPANPQPLTITHRPAANNQLEGQPVGIEATVAATAGSVSTAAVHFRAVGQPAFVSAPLVRLEGTDTWRGLIPGDAVTLAGVQYYLTAADDAAHTAADPTGAPATRVHTFTVSADGPEGPTVQHIPVANGRPANQNVTVEATVTDPSGVSAVVAYYRPTGFPAYQQIVLAAVQGVPNLYRGSIPAFLVAAPGVQYYLRGTDTQGNQGYAPDGAPGVVLSFTVAEANPQGPDIVHIPVADEQPQGQDVAISATVTDPSGVASVILSYRVEGEAEFIDLPLSPGADDTYAAVMPGAAVQGLAVEYHLTATDLAAGANARRDPVAGEHRFSLIQPDLTGPTVEVVPVADGQLQGQPVTVTATITDAVALDPATAGTLVWGPPGGPFNQAPMAAVGADAFAATIPGAQVLAPEVAYYVVATDAAGNVSVGPAGAPDAVLTFAVIVLDLTGPTVVHTPVADEQPQGQDLTISATVTDPSGVAAVVLSYRAVGAGAFTDLPMTAGADDTYAAAIPGAAVQGLALEYHLTATDLAPGANTRRDPLAGEHRVDLIQPDLTAPVVVVSPVSDGQLEGSPVTVTAIISDAGALNPATAGTLFWGPPGGPFNQAPMLANGNRYTATIPGADVRTPAVAYYVMAADAAGNPGFDPAFTAATPGQFTVAPVVVPDVQAPVIEHTPVASAPAGGVAVLEVGATDDVAVAAVSLFFRVSGAGFLRVGCAPAGADAFTCAVPAFAVVAPGFDYYLSAADAAGNTASLPVAGAAAPFTVSVVADQGDAQAPVIEHTPPEGPIEPGQAFELRATLTDASGIGEARLHFRNEISSNEPGDEPWLSLDLVPGENDEYTVRIPGSAITGPVLAWYFEARDASPGRLRAFEPADAPATVHRIDVEGEATDVAGPSIEAAVPPVSTAGLAITVSARVRDPSGVDEVTLRYRSALTGDWLSAPMQPDAQADTYVATVPGVLAVAPAVEVQIVAVDLLGNVSLSPAADEAESWYVAIEAAAELSPPVIVHSPPATAERDAPLALTARINDASGVASARVYCRARDEDAFEIIDMQLDAGDRWSATLPATCLAGAEVSYYFEATDASPQANGATEPPDAPEALFQVVTLGISPEPDQGVDLGLPADMMVSVPEDLGISADLGTSADLGAEDMSVAADLGAEDMSVAADLGDDLGVQADLGLGDMAVVTTDLSVGTDTGADSDLGEARDGGPGGLDQGRPDVGGSSDGSGGGGGGGCNVADERPAAPALLLLGLLGLVRRRRR